MPKDKEKLVNLGKEFLDSLGGRNDKKKKIPNYTNPAIKKERSFSSQMKPIPVCVKPLGACFLTIFHASELFREIIVFLSGMELNKYPALSRAALSDANSSLFLHLPVISIYLTSCLFYYR